MRQIEFESPILALGDGPQAVICRGSEVAIINIETQEQLLAELRKAKAGQ